MFYNNKNVTIFNGTPHEVTLYGANEKLLLAIPSDFKIRIDKAPQQEVLESPFPLYVEGAWTQPYVEMSGDFEVENYLKVSRDKEGFVPIEEFEDALRAKYKHVYVIVSMIAAEKLESKSWVTYIFPDTFKNVLRYQEEDGAGNKKGQIKGTLRFLTMDGENV